MVEADAGEAGLAYVKARLQGGLSLSKVALDRIDLDAGRVVAIVPAGHPDIHEFGAGIRCPARFAAEALRVELRRLFDRGSAAAMWVEEPNPRRSDAFWQQPHAASTRAWFLDEEVYSLAFADDDDARLLDAIGVICAYPGWGGGGFVTAGAESRRYRSTYELRRESLKNVAEGAVCIVCGAYDGEGFLVWTRE